jgi:hypothetical protein
MKTLLFVLSLILLTGCKKSESPVSSTNTPSAISIRLTLIDSTYDPPPSGIWIYGWEIANNTDSIFYHIRAKMYSTDSANHYVPKERGFFYYYPIAPTLAPENVPCCCKDTLWVESYVYKFEILYDTRL